MSDIVQAAALDGLRFSIGRSLSLSFGVLGRNFGPMALLSIVVSAIETGIDLLLTGASESGGGSAGSFLAIISYALITTPVTYATFRDLRGTKASIRDMYSHGFKRAGRVVGAALAASFVTFIPAALVVVVGYYIGVPPALLVAAAAVYVLYFFVIWFVVIPVQVMEKTRFIKGFSRAAELTHHRRWPLVGLVLIYLVLIAALAALTFGLMYLGLESTIFVELLLIPFSAFYSVFGAVLPAVVYYLLRAEKEGVGIEDIARVFD